MIEDGELSPTALPRYIRAGAGLGLAIVIGGLLGICHGLVEAGKHSGRAHRGDLLSAA